MRPKVAKLTPTPAPGFAPRPGTVELFSPRSGLEVLEWYVAQAASASELVCATFAFGINQAFVPMFQTPFAGLRYAMLDSAGTTAAAKETVSALRRRPDNRFVTGNHLAANAISWSAVP